MADPRLQCIILPAGSLDKLKYVVICTACQGKWLLSRHRDRDTWETQGGHIEPGETPLEAARRELFEESGEVGVPLYHVCDYVGYTDVASAGGAVFLALCDSPATLPDSEMAETALFSPLPENLTYPLVTPRLMEACEIRSAEFGIRNFIR